MKKEKEQKVSWCTSLGQNKETTLDNFLGTYLKEAEFFNSAIYASYLRQLDQDPDPQVVEAIEKHGGVWVHWVNGEEVISGIDDAYEYARGHAYDVEGATDFAPDDVF